MSLPIRVCVFDAYGTLFDVAAAARIAATEPGRAGLADRWAGIADTWRRKQLQYSWLRTITGNHADFWTVTEDGLDFALEAAGLAGDAGLRARLLALYWELKAYPEVTSVLGELKSTGFHTAILSNGARGMLDGAVTSAGIGHVLDAVLSVEEVGVFKPDRRVYDLVGRRFGTRPSEVLFVSSNGWDAAAAAGYGFVSVFVNRQGDPIDRLPWQPAHVMEDLTAVPDLAAAL
jgi:2-haloacid dehalogenase